MRHYTQHLDDIDFTLRRLSRPAPQKDGVLLSPDRITVRGYGEAYPIAPISNSAGRHRNRRVEITILHEGKKATDVQRSSEEM